LAELTGFNLYCDTENGLIFESFGNGQEVYPLDYAEDVLDYRFERSTAHAERVEAWGESPGSSAGAESWSWLTKDFEPRRGSAGTGTPLRLLEHAALRTKETAQRAADALLKRVQDATLRGEVTILGNPGVNLGDSIRLQGMPDDDLNATWQVRGVRHRLTKSLGFLTTMRVHATEVLV
jgi:phage protein D